MFLWAYQHEACSDMRVGAELQVLHHRVINRLTAGVSHCQVRGVEATPQYRQTEKREIQGRRQDKEKDTDGHWSRDANDITKYILRKPTAVCLSLSTNSKHCLNPLNSATHQW